MRASVLRGVHDVGVEERPMPQVGRDDVLVQVGSVGVCGSDVHYYEHGRIGAFVVDAPLVLGHEAGGRVVELGADVDRSLADRRVSIEPGVPCRQCRQCLGGHYNLCPDVRFFATPPFDGAFCEYVAVPASFVYPVPDRVSDDAAGLLEPLSVGVWSCRRAGVAPGARVLVTGAGPIGLVAAQAAVAFGAAEVVVTDVNEHRLALAKQLGLTPLDVTTTSLADAGFEPDVLIECSGSPQATGEAIRVVARAGRVVLVGMGPDEIPLPLSYVQDRELTILGAFRYANTWPTAVALAAGGDIELDGLVTGHYGLDQVEDALTAARRDPTTVKPVVRPNA